MADILRRKTCCALRPSINRRSPFFDPTSKTIAIVRLHESYVWHTFLRSNYAPHCTETVIAQVYDLTVALRNNYIPLTQLLLRKLTRPFLREGGAGVRDYAAVLITEDHSVEIFSRLRRLAAWNMQDALGSCSGEAVFVS